jgi:soluble lytic murein transglycosylase-like protein
VRGARYVGRGMRVLLLSAWLTGPLVAPPLAAQKAPARRGVAGRAVTDEYDETFRKYGKRFFGVGFDWRYFKAQAMAESNLVPSARSWVGARGLMQLMPTTYQEIQSRQPEFRSIDDPEWNIAAGIMHDRYLWRLWKDHAPDAERRACMFASYNAGQGTLARAHRTARGDSLNEVTWTSIELVAPKVQRWRYRETLGYVKKIEANYAQLKAEGGPRPR